nr:hypothetical protein [uncultured Desulfobacter sp.]
MAERSEGDWVPPNLLEGNTVSKLSQIFEKSTPSSPIQCNFKINGLSGGFSDWY